MIPASRLFDICSAIVQAIVDHYTDEGLAADLPERRYVANGLPAFDLTEDQDCDEQLTVFVENTFGIAGSPLLENPSERLAEAGHAMRAGTFAITMVRCVPTIDDHAQIPTVVEEQESAQTIYADAVLMLNALVAAQRAGELPGCGSITFLRWQNENAQGGVGGGTLRVAISLSDAF